MTEKPEELSKQDLDKVQGGYTKVEWERGFTATDDLAKVKSAAGNGIVKEPISSGDMGSGRRDEK